jgi:PAS domain S-box-containing protein
MNHPQLRAESAAPVVTATTPAPAEGLDLASVLRMSQAVSGEIVLEKLIDTLMSIALEYAGAQHGLLILPHGETQRIQAEAAIGDDKVQLGMRHAIVTPADLPESILRHVMRTQESVLLHDASLPNPYSSDPYIARGRSRSILCLPLLKQAKLIGVLYLENPLAPRVFTPARIAVLNLLASQAAISLENARFYAELQGMAEALRRSEERYALVMEATGEGYWDWIVPTDDFYASPRLKEMYGLSADANYANRAEFVPQVPFHPEDRPKWQQSIDAHFAGETERFDIDVRIVPRGELRWVHVTGLLKRDAAGKPVRWNGTVSDITARKAAQDELFRVEGQLRQAQRLEAMGTLAGGIAHDFNNILGAILGFGEMALRGSARGSRMRRDLDSIMTAAERGRALVDRILAFSRSGVGDRISVHVEAVVRDALELVAATLPAGIAIVSDLQAGRAAMQGDPTQVDQVLMNLVTNAIHAMAAGGTLRVSLNVMPLDAPRGVTTGTIEAGEYLVLEVADSGTGMSKEILERIFDPFFTTKEVGVGTGLGLSLVHGIVSELGGAIDVASAPGVGSVFTVYLPRAGDAVETEEDMQELEWPRGDRQQVLVVDDEEALVRLTTENLVDLGYVPVGFTSSTAALEAFQAHPERFDAVITDERMPGMSGTALIREIRHIDATLPALLVSGYIGGDLTARAKAAGAGDVLKKPMSMRTLATSLARVLRRVDTAGG